jgi:hypothetical protein
MTRTDVLLQLLQVELWKHDLPQHGALDREAFHGLMEMAVQQTVEGLLCSALFAQNIHLDRYDLAQAFACQGSIELNNKLLNHELVALCQLLSSHQIRFFVVKGQTLAVRYPHPAVRTGGDIDFYCYPEDFERCKGLIEQEWGITITSDDDDDDAQHLHFEHNEVLFEMHYRLMKFSSGRNQRRFDEMIAQALLDTVEVDGYPVPVLPESLNILYTFLHLYHHLIEVGVGLRQFCDVAILLDQVKHVAQTQSELVAQLHRLGFTGAFQVIENILAESLGLSKNRLLLPIRQRHRAYSAKIMDIVFLRGNFGKYGRTHAVRSGWKYNLEMFLLKVRQYFCLFPLSPWENTVFLFKVLPVKILRMGLSGGH